MGTKTISIMDDVYDELVKHKQDSESFSDELRRLIKSAKPDIMRMAGAWKDFDKKKMGKLEEGIKKSKTVWSKSDVEDLLK